METAPALPPTYLFVQSQLQLVMSVHDVVHAQEGAQFAKGDAVVLQKHQGIGDVQALEESDDLGSEFLEIRIVLLNSLPGHNSPNDVVHRGQKNALDGQRGHSNGLSLWLYLNGHRLTHSD